MSIQSGFRKLKKYISDSSSNHKLISYWTSSQTVEFDSGITLEESEVILTKAEYEALEEAGKVDPNVKYYISDAYDTMRVGSATTLGVVKVDGTTITADEDGTIHGSTSVDIATTEKAGIVKPDGTTIAVATDGTINTLEQTLTKAEYDALEEAGKIDPNTKYYISDVYDTTHIASASTLGVVKVDGTTITADADGTIHGSNSYTLPTASTTTLGGVKIDGDTITIDENGVISGSSKVDVATTEKAGIVKPDGTTIAVDSDGKINALEVTLTREEYKALETAGKIDPNTKYYISDATSTIQVATTELLGVVKVDGTTITADSDGTLHSTIDISTKMDKASPSGTGDLTMTGDVIATKSDATTVSMISLDSAITSSLAKYDATLDTSTGTLTLTTRS